MTACDNLICTLFGYVFCYSNVYNYLCLRFSNVFKIIPGKTLLFFDEIQSCIPAISFLRFFYEKLPDLHVVAAGSLLEIVDNGRISYSGNAYSS